MNEARERAIARIISSTPTFDSLRSWLPVIVVVAIAAFFSFASEAFFTTRNLSAISGQASVLLIACLGATFVILMGSIDLAVGAMVLLTAAITVKILNFVDLGAFTVLIAVMIGSALGSFNGVIFAVGRIPSFVVTLGSYSLFTGAGWALLQGRAVSFDAEAFGSLAIGSIIPGIPNIALWAIASWAVMVFVCFKTRFGRYMYILGGGESVARTAGIPILRYKIYALALSGAMAGMAGALALSRQGAVGPTMGQNLLLNTLAAIVVGGTSLSGGIGGVHRTLIGVLIIALLDNGLNLMGVDQYSQMMVKGAVVIIAVLIGQDRRKTKIMK